MIDPNEGGAAPPGQDTGITRHKSALAERYEPSAEGAPPVEEERDMLLSHREAEAGSPADVAACGEEDPGSGLEFLVTRENL